MICNINYTFGYLLILYLLLHNKQRDIEYVWDKTYYT